MNPKTFLVAFFIPVLFHVPAQGDEFDYDRTMDGSSCQLADGTHISFENASEDFKTDLLYKSPRKICGRSVLTSNQKVVFEYYAMLDDKNSDKLQTIKAYMKYPPDTDFLFFKKVFVETYILEMKDPSMKTWISYASLGGIIVFIETTAPAYFSNDSLHKMIMDVFKKVRASTHTEMYNEFVKTADENLKNPKFLAYKSQVHDPVHTAVEKHAKSCDFKSIEEMEVSLYSDGHSINFLPKNFEPLEKWACLRKKLQNSISYPIPPTTPFEMVLKKNK